MGCRRGTTCKGPAAASATARRSVWAALGEAWEGAAELSARLGFAERDIYELLAGLFRHPPDATGRLEVEPARCLACGQRFAKRERMSPPGRCPLCRSERIEPPRFKKSGGM